MPGSPLFRTVAHCFRTILPVLVDLLHLAVIVGHSRRSLAAENLFLRKQLALFQERKVKPRRADDATRWMMVTLSHLFPWRGALVNVKAEHVHRLAPQRVPAVLALEVQTDGTTAPAQEASRIDPRNGRRESDLGRGTDCQRIETETRDSSFAPHRGEVPAQRWPGAHARSKTALAELRPQPCQGDRGM